MIGKVSAFAALFELTVPSFCEAFDAMKRARTLSEEVEIARAVYDSIPTLDFSRDVASLRSERLAVIDLPLAGWTDLGEPSRVLDVLADRRRPGSNLHLAAS
jgi:hypothetical protein